MIVVFSLSVCVFDCVSTFTPTVLLSPLAIAVETEDKARMQALVTELKEAKTKDKEAKEAVARAGKSFEIVRIRCCDLLVSLITTRLMLTMRLRCLC